MRTTLSEIAEIRSGHPFRGAIKEFENGNGYVIQTRNQSAEGNIEWQDLIKTDVSGRKEPEWLRAGEIIFAARGIRNLASLITNAGLKELDLPVVCSPHYFHIRVHEQTEVLPDFIVWQLNQKPIQRYFHQSAEGSLQVSIRRTVLENTPIIVPPMAKQQMVVELTNKAKQEQAIYQKLIKLRQSELDTIAKQLLQDTKR